MKLHLNRIKYAPDYTIGRLLIDDKFECNTLEDTCREMAPDGSPFQVSFEKIHGKTAIPAGTYRVVLSYSQRFHKKLPELLNVPGFSGIRIHSGNTAEDTEGCILVGIWAKENGSVLGSRDTFEALFKKLENAVNQKEEITIVIDPR